MNVRRAIPEDADELVRLRKVMLDTHRGPDPDIGWQPVAVATLRRQLADPDGDLAAFVVDRPGRPDGLAACVIGAIQYRLGGPGNPAGTSGYVFSVATDPDMRRRGFSRACMGELLDWFRQREVRAIDLFASADGEPLYESLGFIRRPQPAMRLTL
jgi:GNAT superfamily N-acetyltransferase